MAAAPTGLLSHEIKRSWDWQSTHIGSLSCPASTVLIKLLEKIDTKLALRRKVFRHGMCELNLKAGTQRTISGHDATWG